MLYVGAGELLAYCTEAGSGAGDPNAELYVGAAGWGAARIGPFCEPPPSNGSSGEGPLFSNACEIIGDEISAGQD